MHEVTSYLRRALGMEVLAVPKVEVQTRDEENDPTAMPGLRRPRATTGAGKAIDVSSVPLGVSVRETPETMEITLSPAAMKVTLSAKPAPHAKIVGVTVSGLCI